MNLNNLKPNSNKLQVLFLLMLSFICNAQNSGDVAQNFGSATHGFSHITYSSISQPDGRILVGGFFTSYGGATQNKIIRLQPDGAVDATFNIGIGFDIDVRCMALQTDGKILVGGTFTSFNGEVENRIIRLNTDGTKDSSFVTGTGFNDTVLSIAVQLDGKIIVGGVFTSYNGVTENRIVRLNGDGSKDTSFDTGTGFNNVVATLAILPDGKIIIGGDFTLYKGILNNKIICLQSNGNTEVTFNTETGFNITASVLTIALQPDGKILVGGSLITYKGLAVNNLVRLNLNGTRDISFSVGIGFNLPVRSISVHSNGKLTVGGDFDLLENITQNGVVRLNANGARDNSFLISSGFSNGSSPHQVRTVILQEDEKIIVAGTFNAYKGLIANNIIRLNPDGNRDTSFGAPGFNSNIVSVALQPDGKILAGGYFTSYKSVISSRLIRLNEDATQDATFNIGAGFNERVSAITFQPDSKIIAGGYFTTFNNATQNNIIRLNADGTKDPSFDIGTGFNGPIHSIVVQPDGKIIVGGFFTAFKGLTENNIIRLNPNGTKDSSFNTSAGFNSAVNSIVRQPDGKLIVGGSFSSYKGISEKCIIRLNADGTKDTSFATGTSFNNTIFSLTLQPDGKIIVGGAFSSYNGTTEKSIIRLNGDGTKDTTFITGAGFNDTVYSTAFQPTGKIIAVGWFTSYNSEIENRIIRLNANGSKDVSFNTGTGFDNIINAVALQQNGEIIVGGHFNTYNGSTASARLITLYGDSLLSNEDFTNESTITLWPNPAKNIVNISNLTEPFTMIRIYNMQGKQVLQASNTTNVIDVAQLASGIYIMHLQSDTKTTTRKFIKV